MWAVCSVILYCPDGVISIENNKAVIDYDFCKGCGICRKICKSNAIEMEAEKMKKFYQVTKRLQRVSDLQSLP